jgi:hypothetical protein
MIIGGMRCALPPYACWAGREVSRWLSTPCVAGGSRDGDGVAQVREAGDLGEGALEVEAEAAWSTVFAF